LSRRDLLLILLTSVGLILVFPPFPIGCAAGVVLVPFFFYLKGKGAWDAFRGGYLIGVIWTAGTIYWISWATVPGFIGALLFVPLYTSGFAIIQSWLWRRWGARSLWAAPFLWTCIELAVSWGVMGFPWLSLAYSQTYLPSLIQYASITGMYGVTFWVVMLNVLFFYMILRLKNQRPILFPAVSVVLLFIVPWIMGRWAISRAASPNKEVTISLVQGNIDPYKKWTPSFVDSNFVVYDRLTALAGEHNPDLLVWPETAAPCYLRHRFSQLKKVKPQIDQFGVPLLTGAPDYEWIDRETVKKYNAALLLHPNSWKMDRYYKNHLVPFSERVPLADRLPLLYDLLLKIDPNVGDFSPGDSLTVFEFKSKSLQEKVRFAAVICYDSIFSNLVRSFIKQGAQFLVIITNDGWFGKTSGPYQHAQMAVYRAIENRVWVARCANTGISEFIDPFGRIQSKTDLNTDAVLTGTVGLSTGPSIFVRHGHLFPWFIIIVNIMILIFTFFSLKIRKQSHKKRRGIHHSGHGTSHS